MFKRLTNEKLDRLKKFLLILLLVLTIIFFVRTLFGRYLSTVYEAFLLVFTPFLIALILTYLCEPIVFFLHKKLKIKKIIVILLIMFIGLAIIALLGYFFYVFVLNQIIHFFNHDALIIYEKIVAIINDSPLLSKLFANTDFSEYQFKSKEAIDVIKGFFSTMSNVLINLILIPIFFVVLLLDKNKIFFSFANMFSRRVSKHLISIGQKSNIVVRSYFSGKIISMFFIWIYFSITFALIGLSSYSLFFALILTVLDLLPYIGPFIGIIIPVLYSYIFGDSIHPFYEYTPLVVIIINLIGQALQNYVIIPCIVGKKMKISAVLILVSMLFFGKILGIWGVILSIPLCGIIKVIYNYLLNTYDG